MLNDKTQFNNSINDVDEKLMMRFFNSSTLCCIIVFVSNLILTAISTYSLYAKATYISGCIVLLILYIAGNFTKTFRQKKIVSIVFCIIVNIVIFPLLFVFSGGIHSAVPMYFIFGIVTTILLLNKRTLAIILTIEACTHATVLGLSYFKPDIVEYFMIVKEERYAAVAIGSVLTGLALGIVLRLMVFAFDNERDKVNTLVKELEDVTVRDVLTGAYNRRYLMENIETLSKQVEDGEINTFSIIMYDLDHFKSINDTYGHVVGDEVLKSFANILKRNLRDKDILSRYGGEEFIIVLPTATNVASFRRAEQIRAHVETTCLCDELKTRVTVSGGICEYASNMTPQEMIEKADTNLYIAKESGRNKIVWKQGAQSPVCYSVYR